MARFQLYLVLLLSFTTFKAHSAKLNVPRVLIPIFNSIQVNFTLDVTDGGCYKWSSSREDVVGVKALPGHGGCSTSALVQSAPRLRHRNTAIILAEDIHTKQVLRCDVIVDTISSLDVVTTTRELYVEEAPEAFEIRAYDDQGNEFTTLEGVEFTWTLVSPLKDNDVIRIMTFSESLYEATESLQALEARGLRGHTALLEGVKTGSAKVIMKLPHSEYSAVNSVEVALRVVANLLLVPSEACLLPGDSVDFRIVQVREGRLIEVPQPSPQYSLEIEDGAIARLHSKTGLATALKHGATRVLLRDAGEEESPDSRPPEAALRVGEVHRLQLAGRPAPPSRPWSLQQGNNFSIHVQMLDSEERYMHIGPETRIAVTLDEELFQVTWRSQNGSVVYGVALKLGTVSITATLLSVAGNIIYPKISTSGELNIYEKIQIIPSEVVLPLDPSSTVRPEFQLRAVGGDGTYNWQREGSAIAIGRFGLLTGLTTGTGTVIASISSNPHIFATASVRVVEPARMEIIWNDGEGPVKSGLALHIVLYSKSGESVTSLPYTDCDKMPFEITPIDGVTFERVYPEEKEEKKRIGKACTVLYVSCSEAGSGRVLVSQGELRQEASLACHAPLTRVFPVPQHDALLLTVGSTANVIYSGGPTSWSGGQEPVHRISTTDPEVAIAVFYSPSHYSSHVYTVTCLKLGHTDMTLKVLRGGTQAVLAEATLAVHCNSPHSLRISVKRAPDSQCPISYSSQVPILSGSGSLVLEVGVLDMRGSLFHNASSVRVRWTAQPAGVFSDPPSELLQTQLNAQFSPIPVPEYHYQNISITSVDLPDNGVGEIVGEVYGYKNSILRSVGVRHTPQLMEVPKTSLSIKIVQPLQAKEDKIVLYNLASNEGRIALLHGSGHISLQVSPPGLLKTALEGSVLRSIRLQPLREGQASILAHDLCLRSAPLIIQVSIVTAYGISSDLPPLIEKGQSVECWVRLLDRVGLPLSQGVLGAPELIARVGAGSLSIGDSTTDAKGAVKYIITGVEEGDARLDFVSGMVHGSSNTRVFPPLRVSPRVAVLMPGGSVRLSTLGGPPPPAAVTFSHADTSHHIKVQSNGVVDAVSAGTSIVEARAELGGASYGRASASVRVRMLEGVAIHAPTTTLLAGSIMPLWATGIPEGIGPMELGSLKPALHFSWSVTGDSTANILDVLENTGVELDDTDRVSVRLTAARAGKIKIHLNVTAERGISVGRGTAWSASLEVSIVDPLRLVTPSLNTDPLLLAPNSQTLLETNYQLEKVTFKVTEEDGNIGRSPLVEVSPQGKVTSFNRLGRAVLTVTGSDPILATAQHITTAIEVVPVQYTSLQLMAGARMSGLAALPQGLSLRVSALRHDAIGRRLAGDVTQLRGLTTRSDVVQLRNQQNTSIEILLADPGRSMFKMTDISSDKQFSDFVSLKVQAAIHPQQMTATVGDMWCARSGVPSAGWGSSDQLALRVTSNGLVQVLADRPAPSHIYLSAGGSTLRANAPVLTRHADKLYFLEGDKEHIFTDEKPYTAHLVLANHDEHDKLTNVLSIDKECLLEEMSSFPFSCELKQHSDSLPLLHVSVEPVLDVTVGKYGCRVTWSPESVSDPEALSNGSTASKLSIVARTGALSPAIIGARPLRAARLLTPVLHLSPPPALAAHLEVMGSLEVLEQIKVEVGSEVPLLVQGPERVSEAVSRYVVTGTKGSAGTLRTHLRVLSRLTHQDVEVSVSFGSSSSLMGAVCPGGGSSSLLRLLEDNVVILVTLVFTVACAMITMWVYNSYISPVLKARHIPVQGSPRPFNDLSSTIRSMNYHSRSPLSSVSPMLQPSTPPSSPANLGSDSTVYGDPSYLSSPERRRNRRFL